VVVISGFDWDDDNVLHIERHQFTPDEVEEVFAGDYPATIRSGELARICTSPWAKRLTAGWPSSCFAASWAA
jgi:hypothetical protein